MGVGSVLLAVNSQFDNLRHVMNWKLNQNLKLTLINILDCGKYLLTEIIQQFYYKSKFGMLSDGQGRHEEEQIQISIKVLYLDGDYDTAFQRSSYYLSFLTTSMDENLSVSCPLFMITGLLICHLYLLTIFLCSKHFKLI